MSEPGERVIMIALPVLRKIEQLDPKQAAAVNEAIDNIGLATGTVIDLPTGDLWNPYFALRSGHPRAPVVIYRKARPGENGDYLVVSLMSPEQYRQQKADEQSGMLSDPVVREEIRVAAGTAAAVAQALPGIVTVTSPGETTQSQIEIEVRSLIDLACEMVMCMFDNAERIPSDRIHEVERRFGTGVYQEVQAIADPHYLQNRGIHPDATAGPFSQVFRRQASVILHIGGEPHRGLILPIDSNQVRRVWMQTVRNLSDILSLAGLESVVLPERAQESSPEGQDPSGRRGSGQF